MVWYAIPYYIAVVVLLITLILSLRKGRGLGNHIAAASGAGLLTVLVHTFGFFTDMQWLNLFSKIGCEFLVDIAIIQVLQYVVYEVEGRERTKKGDYVFFATYVLAVADLVFQITRLGILEQSGGVLFWYHCAFCMLGAIAIMYVYVKKMSEMPMIYRNRYSFSLVAIVVISVLDAFITFGIIPSTFGNLSFLVYAIYCPLLYWSNYDRTSRGMMNTIRKMVLEYVGPVILFDYEGYLADVNKDMLRLFPELAHTDILTVRMIDFLQMGNFKQLQGMDKNQAFDWYPPNDADEQMYRCNFYCLRDEKNRFVGNLITLRTLEAEKDPMTGLYTREGFWHRMRVVEATGVYPVALCVCNANGIGLVNDLYGWERGNEMIYKLASLMRECLPPSAFLASVNDGDMAAIMVGVEQDEATKWFEKLRERYRKENDTGIDADVEYGITVVRSGGRQLEKCYREAVDSMRTKKLLNGTSKKSSLVDSLSQTLAESDYETEEHVERTREMSAKLGRALHLSDTDMGRLSLLAVLHDIGKIAIPHAILTKPGKLNDEEWEIMKTHTEKGYRIASVSPELNAIADCILHHHERWDGTGYPGGLKGEEIPLLARIITVVDSYDVMVNDRPYHKAMSVEEAEAELIRCSGTQFDPQLIQIFLQVLHEEKKEQQN